nr:GNAT family N-acetyltransferase [Ardenticatena sp.]
MSEYERLLTSYACCTGTHPMLPDAEHARTFHTQADDSEAVLIATPSLERAHQFEIIFYHAVGPRADALMRRLFHTALPTLQADATQLVTTFRPVQAAWDLRHWGFEPLDRLRMVRNLTTFHAPEPLVADEYFIAPLRDAYVDDLVRPFITANAGTVEHHLFAMSPERARTHLRTFATSMHTSNNQVSFVVLHSGTPVGALLARRPTPERGELWQIFVAPEHQGRGLGRALLLTALRALKEQGAREAEVESARHLPAYFLLRWLGFEDVSTIPLRFWLKVMST